jgi:hypothetical protein
VIMETSSKTPPTLLAFLIADSIIDDITTRKKSIIGLFNSICSPRFPFRHSEMNLFVSLTDGHGEYNCTLICTRSEDEKEVFKTGGKVKFQTPNSVVEINFSLRNVEFPTAGKYTFQFFCDDYLLVIRPFEVVKMEKDIPPWEKSQGK